MATVIAGFPDNIIFAELTTGFRTLEIISAALLMIASRMCFPYS